MAEDKTTKKPSAKTSKKPSSKKTTRRKKVRASAMPSHTPPQALSDNNTPADSNQPDLITNQQSRGETRQATGAEGAGVAQLRAHNVVAWIALLLGGLALGASAVVWYLTAGDVRLNVQQHQVDRIVQHVDELDAMQSDNHNALDQLKTQITQATDDFSKQIKTIQNNLVAQKSASEQATNAQADDFRQQFDTLSDSIIKLRANLGRGVDSWTLEKAEQLIFMANQQVQFAGQFTRGNSIAKRALHDADALLQKLADPTLNAVRQLLTAEITALDNVKVVNTVGVLNALSVLSDTVENLALAGDIVISAKTATRTTTDTVQATPDQDQAQAQVSDIADSSGISQYIQPIIDAGASLLSSMTDMIQVEKNGKPIKPVMSAELRQMIYQKTQLILDSAQIAFIRQQPELYRNRIQATRSWVEEHFDQNADETVNWLARLDDVGSMSQAKIPDISASLKAIRAILNSRNQ